MLQATCTAAQRSHVSVASESWESLIMFDGGGLSHSCHRRCLPCKADVAVESSRTASVHHGGAGKKQCVNKLQERVTRRSRRKGRLLAQTGESRDSKTHFLRCFSTKNTSQTYTSKCMCHVVIDGRWDKFLSGNQSGCMSLGVHRGAKDYLVA